MCASSVAPTGRGSGLVLCTDDPRCVPGLAAARPGVAARPHRHVYATGDPGPQRASRGTWRCLTLVFVVMIAARSHALADTPDDTLRAFYTWVLAHPSLGLPAPHERIALAPVVSPRLLGLLDAAARTQERCTQAAPEGDKPLLLEGDLFVGNHEGATEIAYGELRRIGDRVSVESDLFYVDHRFPQGHRHRGVAWRDRVEIRLIGNRWYVDEVRLRGARTLSGVLEAYIAEGAKSCTLPVPAKPR